MLNEPFSVFVIQVIDELIRRSVARTLKKRGEHFKYITHRIPGRDGEPRQTEASVVSDAVFRRAILNVALFLAFSTEVAFLSPAERTRRRVKTFPPLGTDDSFQSPTERVLNGVQLFCPLRTDDVTLSPAENVRRGVKTFPPLGTEGCISFPG